MEGLPVPIELVAPVISPATEGDGVWEVHASHGRAWGHARYDVLSGGFRSVRSMGGWEDEQEVLRVTPAQAQALLDDLLVWTIRHAGHDP
jgi:hypothetical protein